MRPGEGLSISPLDSSAKHINITQAEDGFVWLTVVDADEQRAVQITLSDGDALDLAAALRNVTRR